jgi:preprotein translocase subunit YajC
MDLASGAIVLATAIAAVFLLVWIVVIVPQNRARKNQEKVVEELQIGEQIVTVGGVIGKLTYLDREKDLARIEVAPGVEIRIIPAAISHPLDYMQRIARLEQEQGGKGKTPAQPASPAPKKK